MTFYDSEATFKESLKESNYTMMQIGKVYQIRELWSYDGELQSDYTYNSSAKLTKAELDKFAKTYGKEAFGATSVYFNLNVQNRNA